MKETKILAIDLENIFIKSDFKSERKWKSSFLSSFESNYSKIVPSKNKKVLTHNLVFNDTLIDYCQKWKSSGGNVVLYTYSEDLNLYEIKETFEFIHDIIIMKKGSENDSAYYKSKNFKKLFQKSEIIFSVKLNDIKAFIGKEDKILLIKTKIMIDKNIYKKFKEIYIIDCNNNTIFNIISSLRVYQWIKNLLIFIPLLATHETSLQHWVNVIFVFVSFSLVASSTYILNDIFDLYSDRQHEIKKHRPLAAGNIGIQKSIFLALLSLIIGLSITYFIDNLLIFFSLVFYFILTNFYSYYFKNFLGLDICLLACFYTLRVFIGWMASYVSPLSVWLFAFSMFLFLGLAAIKRQAEIVYFYHQGKDKLKGRPYHVDDLTVITGASLSAGFISVLIFALYINSPQVYKLYNASFLLYIICPILLYWILRLVFLSNKGKILEDPIIFSIKDKISILCLFLVLTIFFTAKYFYFEFI